MHCYARYLFLFIVALLGLGQMMTACGQKGPLYHPDQSPEEAVELPGADEILDQPPPARR